jgi:bis(5'-nucleosyl)-tetraphosphatase (symmetrical)
MATYVIGDIHGCFLTLQGLLQKIRFSSSQDRLWLVGDLVARGPRSLEVLRWAREMGERVVTVLGNHDLHLLARALGVAPPKRKDLLRSLPAAEDQDELLVWLRHRPLILFEKPYVLIHAGLLPQWNIEEAEQYGREVEQVLNGPQAGELLKSLTWKKVPLWDERLAGYERHGTILRAMTELRTIGPDGSMCLHFAGPLHEIPNGATPWFSAPLRKSKPQTILFGHWAALGFYQAPGIVALDSGCAWGGMLTAVRLEDNAVFQQPNLEETPR